MVKAVTREDGGRRTARHLAVPKGRGNHLQLIVPIQSSQRLVAIGESVFHELHDLGLGETERRVEVRRLYVETREARTELIAGDSPAAIGTRLADRLREVGLI